MKKLKIAIQKSGRLNKDSLDLLSKCWIKIDNYKDQLKASSRNFPIEVYFLRNSDIPKYINDGVVDLAIIGENLLIEKDYEITVFEKLGFSKCKVSIAVPNKFNFNSEWIKLRSKQHNTSIESFVETIDDIKISTLDNYCANNKINTIDLLKIDTQGYEDKVLKGS